MNESPVEMVNRVTGATDAEKNLAEDVVALVEKFSRLIGAAEDGSWRYVNDKLGDVRQGLQNIEHRLTRAVENPDDPYGEVRRVFQDPGVDQEHVQQLITAYAQQYGGRLGPVLFPIEGLESEELREAICASQERTKKFMDSLDKGDVPKVDFVEFLARRGKAQS
ncbi:hypothetical protein ACWDXD_24725 [Streptomyces sp. NPDC003314]